MRIGIITYWQSNDNYGQQLQCWALQHYLKLNGHDPFLIRFKRFERKLTFRDRIKKTLKTLLKIILVKPYISERKAKELDFKRQSDRDFVGFRRDFLAVSDSSYTDLETIRHYPPMADAYITGSDQVWNYDLTEEELRAYLLQFGESNIRRISYAPSIAHKSIPATKEFIYEECLKDFSAISVREPDGVSALKKLGYDAELVLDPTLLLHDYDYIEAFNIKVRQQGEPYVFIYSLNYESESDLPMKYIRNVASNNQAKIIVTPSSGFLPALELFDGVTYKYQSVPDWVSCIGNSQLVVTASFHGVVFSILFHKNFIFTPLKGNLKESNNRALNIINKLGLEQTIWNGCYEPEFDFHIDWSDVDKKLNNLRTKSISFIRRALNKMD